jgi:pimeloyl-ACP methyl ester carboxylesterase
MKILGLFLLLAACSSSAPHSSTTEIPAMSHAHYLNVNGLHMYYEDHGEDHGTGRPLVLIHGGGSTIQTSFGRLLPRLARARRVIAVEQQAHGHTEDLDRPLSFEQMADDTAALLEQLGVREADVLGFSNGGMTALQLAVRHPALVRRLIVCSGFYAKRGFIPALTEMFDRPPNAEAMPPVLRDAYLAASPHPDLQALMAKTGAMMKSFPDLSEEAVHAIAVPTLVMLGDQDVIQPEHAAQLARLVQHGQLAIFPGSGHGTYLGVAEAPADPKLFELGVAVLERFLAE